MPANSFDPTPITHKAPWGKMLRVTSLAVAVLWFGIVAYVCIRYSQRPDLLNRGVYVYLMMAAILGIASTPLFVVKSYTIIPGEILIQRLLWVTRVNVQGLTSAEVIPQALKSSVRLAGNGGAFSFTGWFWSRSLGCFRAFVNDLDRTVVLTVGKRKVVVSPEDPQAFLEDLNKR